MEDARRRMLPELTNSKTAGLLKFKDWATPEGWLSGTGFKAFAEINTYDTAIRMAEERAASVGAHANPSMLSRNAAGVRGFFSAGKDQAEHYLAEMLRETQSLRKAIEEGNKDRKGGNKIREDQGRQPMGRPRGPMPFPARPGG